MRALVFPAIGSAELVDLPVPEPGPGEARVTVQAAGLCTGDLYIYTGKNPYVTFPRVGCHELAGVVAACGREALAGETMERSEGVPGVRCHTRRDRPLFDPQIQ